MSSKQTYFVTKNEKKYSKEPEVLAKAPLLPEEIEAEKAEAESLKRHSFIMPLISKAWPLEPACVDTKPEGQKVLAKAPLLPQEIEAEKAEAESLKRHSSIMPLISKAWPLEPACVDTKPEGQKVLAKAPLLPEEIEAEKAESLKRHSFIMPLISKAWPLEPACVDTKPEGQKVLAKAPLLPEEIEAEKAEAESLKRHSSIMPLISKAWPLEPACVDTKPEGQKVLAKAPLLPEEIEAEKAEAESLKRHSSIMPLISKAWPLEPACVDTKPEGQKVLAKAPLLPEEIEAEKAEAESLKRHSFIMPLISKAWPLEPACVDTKPEGQKDSVKAPQLPQAQPAAKAEGIPPKRKSSVLSMLSKAWDNRSEAAAIPKGVPPSVGPKPDAKEDSVKGPQLPQEQPAAKAEGIPPKRKSSVLSMLSKAWAIRSEAAAIPKGVPPSVGPKPDAKEDSVKGPQLPQAQPAAKAEGIPPKRKSSVLSMLSKAWDNRSEAAAIPKGVPPSVGPKPDAKELERRGICWASTSPCLSTIYEEEEISQESSSDAQSSSHEMQALWPMILVLEDDRFWRAVEEDPESSD